MAIPKGLQLSEEAKGVGAAAYGTKGLQDLNIAHDLSLPKTDDLQISAVWRPSKSGSSNAEITGSTRKGRVEVPQNSETLTGSKDAQVAQDLPNPKPDSSQTSTFFRRPQIGSWFANRKPGSWFAKLTGFMSKSRGAELILTEAKASVLESHGLTVEKIREDLLKFAPTPRSKEAAPLIPEVDEAFKKKTAMVFKGQMEDIKPAEVAELSPFELIRYTADRNLDVENKARKLYEVSDEYTKAERNAFYKASLAFRQELHFSLDFTKGIAAKEYGKTDAMIRDIVRQKMTVPSFKGISENDMTMSVRRLFIEKISVLYPEVEKRLQDLKKAESIYQQAYTDTYQAARQIGNSESLEPQALAQLTDKEYVEKAALYDIKAYQRYTQWSGAEQRLDDIIYDRDLAEVLKNKVGPDTLEKETKILADQLENELKSKGKPINEKSINAVARSEAIKKQALLHPDLREYASRIKSLEKQIITAKNAAIKSADKTYKIHRLLKSSALRHKAWFSRNFFFKKIVN